MGQERDFMLSPGVKHTLEGTGILDSLVTSKQFGVMADRAEEWNFISFHINMVTTMGALGAIGICIGMLLYCSSHSCWQGIWRALTCCRCTMGPDSRYYPPTSKTAMSTPPVAVTAASAPTPGELETLEQAKYLKLAKQKKKQPKVEPDNLAESNGGEKCG